MGTANPRTSLKTSPWLEVLMSAHPKGTAPKQRRPRPSRWVEAVYVAACVTVILTAAALVLGSLLYPGQGLWVVSAKGGSACALFKLALKHLQGFVGQA